MNRSGYTFQGWAEDSTATTVSYYPGESFTKNANTTLYAVWKKSEPNVFYYTGNITPGGGVLAISRDDFPDGDWSASISAPWLSCVSDTKIPNEYVVRAVKNPSDSSRSATVTFLGVGENKAKVVYTVVQDGYVPVKEIKFSSAKRTVSIGSPSSNLPIDVFEGISGIINMSVHIEPSNASNKKIAWRSSNPSIAVIDANGRFVPKKPGVVTVTAISLDGGKTAECEVTIVPIVLQSFKLLPSSAELSVGESFVLNEAKRSPEYAYKGGLIWESSNPKIVTVKDGKITAMSAGKATITCTANDGKFVHGKTVKAVCTVTVVSGWQYEHGSDKWESNKWISVGTYKKGETSKNIKVGINPENTYYEMISTDKTSGNITFEYMANEVNIDKKFYLECQSDFEWSISTNESWIQITSNQSGYDVLLKAADGVWNKGRKGTITLICKDAKLGDITKTILIKQPDGYNEMSYKPSDFKILDEENCTLEGKNVNAYWKQKNFVDYFKLNKLTNGIVKFDDLNENYVYVQNGIAFDETTGEIKVAFVNYIYFKVCYSFISPGSNQNDYKIIIHAAKDMSIPDTTDNDQPFLSVKGSDLDEILAFTNSTNESKKEFKKTVEFVKSFMGVALGVAAKELKAAKWIADASGITDKVLFVLKHVGGIDIEAYLEIDENGTISSVNFVYRAECNLKNGDLNKAGEFIIATYEGTVTSATFNFIILSQLYVDTVGVAKFNKTYQLS